MISVLIVDDHPIVLNGTKALFQHSDDFYIQTEDKAEQVHIRMQQEHFHVFLVDINMLNKNGIELSIEIKEKQKDALIILYTGDDIKYYYPLILEKKVDGILSKTASIEKVIHTIRSVVQGDLVIHSDFIDYVNKKMMDRYDGLKLTTKEIQLMNLLMDGYTNKMIAENLGVTQRTVERYLSQLFNILGVSSRTEAIEMVAKQRLLL